MRAGRLKDNVYGWVVGGLVLAALIGLGTWFIMLKNSPSQNLRSLPPVVGSPVPDFELARLDGSSQKLSSLRGTPVVVNFWATWCPPCKEELPLLERYGKKYAGMMVILGIDSDEEPEVVAPFVRGMGITFPILLDPAGSVADRYFVKDYPYTFFVDQEGILRGQHIGLLREEQLVRYLQTIGIEP